MSAVVVPAETKTIKYGVRNMHHPMIDSVVLWHEPFITRAFIANGPSGVRTVAPHSHRTSIKITVLRGTVTHFTFHPGRAGVSGRVHGYKSEFLGGRGLSAESNDLTCSVTQNTLYVGDTFVLPYFNIHTVQWSPTAVWLVEEGPLMQDETLVFLRSQDNFTTEGMYLPMNSADVKVNRDLVWRLWKAQG